MRSITSIGEYLEHQSVRLVESTIPESMTIAEWRKLRAPLNRIRASRTAPVARRVDRLISIH
jgi:hypothetical protein